MKFKNKKLFSRALSIFLTFTILFSTISTNIAYGSENDVKALFRQTLEESRKDKFVEVKSNLPDAEDMVTLIVEISEKSGKDICKDKDLKEVAKNKEVIEKVLNSQEYYINKIKEINHKAVFSNRYTLVFNGFSVETRYKDKKKIEEIPGIKKVSLANTYYKDMVNAIQMTDIPYIRESYKYDGKGMVVAVLDSGVDYTHKDMVISKGVEVKLTESKVNGIKSKQSVKRGKYFTSKVPFGYNYADKDEDIVDRVETNIDYGHGMHVAGIIGANCQNPKEIKENKGIKGIAPECQILAMKIFPNNPRNQGASERDIIAAVEDAIAYGADVINMSFCSTAGFQNPEDGQQKVIQAAIDAGIIVVTAAGNAAYSTYPKKHDSVIDIGTVGAPGLAKGTIQVASLENSNRITYALNADVKGKSEKIAYVLSDFNPASLKFSYEVVDCGLGKEEDFNNVNVRGKIALIKRGIVEFKDKKLNAQKKGAVGVIIYNGDGEESYLDNISTDKSVKIPTIFIKNSDGIKLGNMIKEGLRVSFSGEKYKIPNVDNDKMSYFTSWGPTPNLDLKPDVTSIGGNIWSTVNNNEYKNMSGTSMATPHTAGIMTLLLQHLDSMNMKFQSGAEKVKYAKTMLMNTAEVKMDKESNTPYSPRIQGAGLVNAKRALENKTLLTYKGNPSISLGEIGKITDISVNLKNKGSDDITYKIEVLCNNDAKVNFNTKEIKVPSGQTIDLKGQLVLGNNIKRDSFVEGFIRFIPISNTGYSVGMPFIGFYGDWANLKIVDEPSYKEGSIFKETSLFTVDQSGFIAKTYPLGGENMNPDYFSINPEDPKSHNNVLPQFSLLRNAKHIKIDVTDSKGVVRKVIEDKENMRKDVAIEQQIPAKVNFEWQWKGVVYDKNLGYKTPLEEGQYYINIRAKADFPNAKEQVTTFPLKIDKTAPKVKAGTFVTNSNECVIEIDARDEGVVDSGIENFLFLVDGKKYVDKNGKHIFKLKKDEDGKYRMKIKIPVENKKSTHTVDIGVTDYADNMTAAKANIIYEPKVGEDMGQDTGKESKLVVENLTNVATFTNGDSVLAKIRAANNENEAKEVTLIVCLYDEYNRLINSAAIGKTIKPGKSTFLTSSIMVPNSGKYKIKIFTWDSIEKMRNLLPYMEIKQK